MARAHPLTLCCPQNAIGDEDGGSGMCLCVTQFKTLKPLKIVLQLFFNYFNHFGTFLYCSQLGVMLSLNKDLDLFKLDKGSGQVNIAKCQNTPPCHVTLLLVY